MSIHNLPPVLSADGQPVEEETLAQLGEPEPVSFWYRGLKFTLFFDRSKVPTDALLRHAAKQAQLQRERIEAGSLSPTEGEDIAELADSLEGLSDEDARQRMGEENWKRFIEFSHRSGLFLSEDQPTLFPIRLRMLTPGIVTWNVRGREHTVESLEADGELARAVIPVLWEIYRPTTTGLPAPTAKAKKESSSKPVSTIPPKEKMANSPKSS